MLLLLATVGLAADVTLTHQGRLLDAAGEPLEGSIALRIGLFDAETGGNERYAEDQTVTLSGGYYSVLLGPLASENLDGDVWLGVSTDGTPLARRSLLTAVPLAAHSLTADQATRADIAALSDRATVADSALHANTAGSASTADSATTAVRATTADAVAGVSVSADGCSDRDVLTYVASESAFRCRPPIASGTVINVTTHVNGSRRVLSDSNNITMETFNVDKRSPTSYFLIQGSISGWGNYSGDMQQGWRYGSNPEVLAQSVMYDNTAFSKIYSTMAVMTGITQTGTQSMRFRYFSANGGTGNRPFVTYNPNGSDEGRNGQTRSVYVVWEIEP